MFKRLKNWFGARKERVENPKIDVWWSEAGVNSYMTPAQRAEYEARWADYTKAHPQVNQMPRVVEKPEVMDIDTGIDVPEWTVKRDN